MMNQNLFGSRLREWRRRRGLSQLDWARAASTTQRHVSFLESGRSEPSPEMVLRLAATLDVPLRQQNTLLLAAGFAPVWQEREFTAPTWKPSTTPSITAGPARALSCDRGGSAGIYCVPMDSTSWDNVASQKVAVRLGLSMFGADFHIT